MRALALYEEGESVYNKTEESYWLHCPKCGTRLQKMLRRTVAYDLPLYCRQCKVEVIVNIGEERVRAEQQSSAAWRANARAEQPVPELSLPTIRG